MPTLVVYEAADGALVIYDGVTRATRAALPTSEGSWAQSSRPMVFIRRVKMLSPLPATST